MSSGDRTLDVCMCSIEDRTATIEFTGQLDSTVGLHMYNVQN